MGYLLHQLLTRAAAAGPDQVAVRDRGRSLTYRELDAAANGVARTLVSGGVAPGDFVGIFAPKSADTVAVIYGILKVGAAYVPIDPRQPTLRAAKIATDSAISALVATTSGASALLDLSEGPKPKIVLLVDGGQGPLDLGCPSLTLAEATADAQVPEPHIPVIDQDVAYVLYTSGSTGMPKGVMLTHRNALTFVEWCASTIGIGPDDRVSSHSPLQFDMSVMDLYLPAMGGATLVLVADEERYFGSALVRLLREERITVWYSVPSALMLITRLAGAVADPFPDLRAVAFAGEVYPTRHLRELRAMLPRVDLWNLYGPTETNVCTCWPVDEVPDDDKAIPIGRACGNYEVFALREDGSLASVGEDGELCVRGSGVMKGYLGRPELTAEVLVPNPLPGRPPDLVYRTGDLARLRPDGNYDLLGRRDHQVKTRGYRVELGEVEARLNSHPALQVAVAVAVPHQEWGTAIVAAVVPVSGYTPSALDVRRHVAELLPHYMVPARVEFMLELPRTRSGKVDRQRLIADVSSSSSTWALRRNGVLWDDATEQNSYDWNGQ